MTALACGQPGKIDSFAADYVVRSADGSETVNRFFAVPGKTRLGISPTKTSSGRVIITRQDIDVVWTIFPSQLRYHESPAATYEGPPLLLRFPKGHIVEELGRERVNGFRCRKVRAQTTTFLAGHTRTTSLVSWISTSFPFPLRMEWDDGSLVELRDIVAGPQPEALFSVPPGYTRIEPRPFDPDRLRLPGSGGLTYD